MDLDELVAGDKDFVEHGLRAVPMASPAAGSTLPATTGVAAGGGLFTAAQWVELQRQSLVYKHMAALAPVPAYLLFSNISASAPASAYYNYNTLAPNYGGYQYQARMTELLRCMQQQAARRRCRRTDGKKWRCARDAAPDQKYCHRHLHRAGRPRPTKPQRPAAADAPHEEHKSTTVSSPAETQNIHLQGGNGLAILDFTGSIAAGNGVRLPEQRENRLSLDHDTVAERYNQYCSGSAKEVAAAPSPSSSTMDVDVHGHGIMAPAEAWVGIGGPLGEVLRYAAGMQRSAGGYSSMSCE